MQLLVIRKILNTLIRKPSLQKLQPRGFSLIELMVTATIMAIISTMAIASYTSYGRSQKLQLAAQILASDIRLMQSHAFALKEISDPLDGGTMKVPPGGWGIHFQVQPPRNVFYRLSADISDNNASPYPQDHELFRQINFNPPIVIEELRIGAATPNDLFVFFETPMATSTICSAPNSCTGGEAEIVLTDDGGTTLKTVKVNRFGLVDIN